MQWHDIAPFTCTYFTGDLMGCTDWKLRVVQWPNVVSLFMACELDNGHCLQYIYLFCDRLEVFDADCACNSFCNSAMLVEHISL